MNKNIDRILKERVKYRVSRFEDPAFQISARDTNSAEVVERIADCAKDLNSKGLIRVSTSLARLASWYSSVGVSLLSKGDIAGWSEIRRPCNYLLLSTEIDIERSKEVWKTAQVAGKRPVEHHSTYTFAYANRLADCVAYACINSMQESCKNLGDFVVAAIKDSNYPSISPLLYFCAWLYEKQNGRDLPVPVDYLARYGRIVAGWEDSSIVQEELTHLCDYHCKRINSKENDLVDFGLAPFDLIPYELLFMFDVRKKLNLYTPVVSHPLLDSEFAHPPIFEPGGDDILKQVGDMLENFRKMNS